MSGTDLEQRLSSVLPRLGALAAAVRFDLGADGQWLLDARGPQASLQRGAELDDVACTIKAKSSDLLRLIDGKLDPLLAYTLGRIKVRGSTRIAMALIAAFGE